MTMLMYLHGWVRAIACGLLSLLAIVTGGARKASAATTHSSSGTAPNIALRILGDTNNNNILVTTYASGGLDYISYVADGNTVQTGIRTSDISSLYLAGGNAALSSLSGADTLSTTGVVQSLFTNLSTITQAISIYGMDQSDTLIGGEMYEYLNGGDHSDSLLGNDGRDVLRGEDGNDVLRGGDGSDSIYGGIGHDTLLGEDLNDSLFGEDGNDSLIGGNDTWGDYLWGGGGNDTLGGIGLEPGHDSMWGDAGNDLMYGDTGNDSMIGGTGADTIYGGTGADRIDGGSDTDVLYQNNAANGADSSQDSLWDATSGNTFFMVTGSPDFDTLNP